MNIGKLVLRKPDDRAPADSSTLPKALGRVRERLGSVRELPDRVRGAPGPDPWCRRCSRTHSTLCRPSCDFVGARCSGIGREPGLVTLPDAHPLRELPFGNLPEHSGALGVFWKPTGWFWKLLGASRRPPARTPPKIGHTCPTVDERMSVLRLGVYENVAFLFPISEPSLHVRRPVKQLDL